MERSRAIRRVRALRAKADSTAFPAEREALLAKVGELMSRYRIAESDLDVVAAPEPGPPPTRQRGPVVVIVHGYASNITFGTATEWTTTGTIRVNNLRFDGWNL